MQPPVDNATCHAYTAGIRPEDARDSVIFVHGAAMEHSVWSLQSRYFAYHGYNVLALDLPGHGGSTGALLPSIEALSEWLLRVVDSCVGRGVHLVGHSMGALIALETAARYRHHQPLRSLTLVGFSYPMTVSPKLLSAAQENPTMAYALMTQWSHASPLGGEPNPGFWSPGMQLSMMANSAPAVIDIDLHACHRYRHGEPALAALRCPVLFLSGRLDKMAPVELAEKQAAICAQSETAIIPGAGHSLLAEKPDEVLVELRQFIGRHTPPV